MGGEFAGKRVVVMGLGRFGGGIGAARWLCAQEAEVHVTDIAPAVKLQESIDQLNNLPISYCLGRHDENDLVDCDLLVISPAIDRARSSFVHAAITRGIPVSSEMNLFLERCPARIVGITGSVGKSTTTAMIGAVLNVAQGESEWRHGRVWLGGNIGKSLLDELAKMRREDIVVLELSSFQLEDAVALHKSPHIAVITNLGENHLDRHVTLAAYAAAKANIYKYQIGGDWLVIPELDNGLGVMPGLRSDGEHIFRVGEDGSRIVLRIADQQPTAIDLKLQVPGRHNLQNAAAAAGVARILGVPDATIVEGLSGFAGLAHRLEYVREYRGVRYFNDSKATSPEAAMTSLQAFAMGRVLLIAGGSDKGSSFKEFGRFVAQHAKFVVCIGDTRQKIAESIQRAPKLPNDTVDPAAGSSSGAATLERVGTRMAPVVLIDEFEPALRRAREMAREGDVVLLSPACASYDWFKNYEDRGESFKRIVQSWK